MNPLVVIPARGGSKGIPGKNIKLLAGKPLIYYTVQAAREIFDDAQIIISTDDIDVKTCVESLGLKVPFLRPPELSTDSAGMHEVLLHAIGFVESLGSYPETLILLQPTSPFRTSRHIREAMHLYDADTQMVVSVKESRANPYFNLYEENTKGWLEKSKKGLFPTRQLSPRVWEFNGGVYIIRIKALKEKYIGDFTEVRKYVMDEFSSHDIDSTLDWELAEILAVKLL